METVEEIQTCSCLSGKISTLDRPLTISSKPGKEFRSSGEMSSATLWNWSWDDGSGWALRVAISILPNNNKPTPMSVRSRRATKLCRSAIFSKRSSISSKGGAPPRYGKREPPKSLWNGGRARSSPSPELLLPAFQRLKGRTGPFVRRNHLPAHDQYF